MLILGGEAVETGGTGRRLVPGTLQLNVPGVRHGWRRKSARFERFGVAFALHPPVPLPTLKRWPVCPEAFDDLAALMREAPKTGRGGEDRVRARLLLFLARRYRAESGTSVMARLAELRMQKAAELLRDTRLPVKAVAARVGFSEPGYFCRCFRRRFGRTPLERRAGGIGAG